MCDCKQKAKQEKKQVQAPPKCGAPASAKSDKKSGSAPAPQKNQQASPKQGKPARAPEPVPNEAGYERCMKKVKGGQIAAGVGSAILGALGTVTFGITTAIGAGVGIGAKIGLEKAAANCAAKNNMAA